MSYRSLIPCRPCCGEEGVQHCKRTQDVLSTHKFHHGPPPHPRNHPDGCSSDWKLLSLCRRAWDQLEPYGASLGRWYGSINWWIQQTGKRRRLWERDWASWVLRKDRHGLLRRFLSRSGSALTA